MKEIIRHEKDTGSSEAQISQLTSRLKICLNILKSLKRINIHQ